jgi:hypothetical protein
VDGAEIIKILRKTSNINDVEVNAVTESFNNNH